LEIINVDLAVCIRGDITDGVTATELSKILSVDLAKLVLDGSGSSEGTSEECGQDESLLSDLHC
jgi:hypothetical protein